MWGASPPTFLRALTGPRGRPDLKNAPKKSGQTAFRYPVFPYTRGHQGVEDQRPFAHQLGVSRYRLLKGGAIQYSEVSVHKSMPTETQNLKPVENYTWFFNTWLLGRPVIADF